MREGDSSPVMSWVRKTDESLRCDTEGCQLYFDGRNVMRRMMVLLTDADEDLHCGGKFYEINIDEIFFYVGRNQASLG